MSHIAEVQEIKPAPFTLAANAILIPFEKHMNIEYVVLSVIFACVLAYMFLSKRR